MSLQYYKQAGDAMAMSKYGLFRRGVLDRGD